MRAELGLNGRSIVFVWKLRSLTNDQVRVFIYDKATKCSDKTYDMQFARSYWDQLIAAGYKRVPGYKGKDDSPVTEQTLDPFQQVPGGMVWMRDDS